MATSLFSQYPTVVIEFCPQTLKRTLEREKINPWLLNHSSWPWSWTILYFFCPGTKCAKDIIWIYHKINCFFLKTEVSLKRLVGWIEFIYLVHNSRFRLSESIQTDCISQLIFSERRKVKKTNYLSCQKNVRVSVRKRKKIIMQSKLSCSVWINDETIKMSLYPLQFIIVSWKCNSDIQLLSRLI